MPLLTKKIPEDCRVILIAIVGDPQFRRPAFKRVGMLEIMAAGHRNARQVPFYVCQEHRHPGSRKLFSHGLERDRLAGAGCPGDQAVAIGTAQPQHLPLTIAPQAEEDLAHVMLLKMRLETR